MSCVRPVGAGSPTLAQDLGEPAWSTFGPHANGTERFIAVSSGASFAQVAGVILGKRAQAQNPDKDEVPGSSPGRPTTPRLTSANVVGSSCDSGFGRIRVRDEVCGIESGAHADQPFWVH